MFFRTFCVLFFNFSVFEGLNSPKRVLIDRTIFFGAGSVPKYNGLASMTLSLFLAFGTNEFEKTGVDDA